MSASSVVYPRAALRPTSCRARVALELCALVRRVRADIAVADDEVVLRERGDELRPRMEAVTGVQHRGKLRVNLVGRAELAVQIVGDSPTERVAVVERKAEGGDAVPGCRSGLGKLGGLRALAGAVDAFDREQHSH